MHAPDLRGLLGLQLAAGLAEQRVNEQATADADATVDAPHRELDAGALERFAPREHVLVHAVHERAVEIEQEGGAGGHESGYCNRVLRGQWPRLKPRLGATAEAAGTPVHGQCRDAGSPADSCGSYFNSMSCGRACPAGKYSKSTSNFASRVIPPGPTFTSRTR